MMKLQKQNKFLQFLQIIPIIALACINPAHAKGSCSVRGTFYLGSDSTWDYSMSTKSGERCSSHSANRSRTNIDRGVDYELQRLYVQERPNHGKVSLIEGGTYEYTSDAKYVGTDRFSLKICGTIKTSELKCAILLFHVDVN